MTYPANQQWGLAVGGVITELDSAHHDEIGGWGDGPATAKWCRGVLHDYYGIETREDILEMLTYLFQQGHTAEAATILQNLGNDASQDDYRESLVRSHRRIISTSGLRAWDSARAVMVAGRGFRAGYLSEMEAWQLIMTAAAEVQQTYDSWTAFAEGYELGRLFSSRGDPHEPTARAIETLLSDPSSPWMNLPFDMELGINLMDKPDAVQKNGLPGMRRV